MKARFLIRNYSFEVIPEINYSDYMDGTPDTMSFSFLTHEDLSEIINIKEKCEVQIWEVPDVVVGEKVGTSLTINDIEYTLDETVKSNEFYDEYYDVLYESQLAGIVIPDTKTIIINGVEEYFYKGNITDDNLNIYKGTKIHYYMCVTHITSEKMSTATDENGYMNTIRLKEQTILLKDCVRTDIAITPSLYPQIESLNEVGETIYENIFDTLYQAMLKVVDCHNMCSLNEPILTIDDDLTYALQQVACPNLTYRDLSTYSQLYDIFMRVGRIPYFSNGTLYGLKLQGSTNTENIQNLNEYSTLSSIKEEGVNDNIYSTKVYNNIYDEEIAVVPQIFTSMVKDIYFTPKTVSYVDGENTVYLNVDQQNYTFTYNSTVYHILRDNFGKPVSVYYNNILLEREYYTVRDDYYTFVIADTELKINGIFDSRNTSTMQISEYDNSPVTSVSDEIYYIDEDGDGSFSPDLEGIENFINVEFNKWTLLNSQSEGDVSKTLLYVRGFDTQGKSIADARSYSIQLPYGIEKLEHIYSCKPSLEVKQYTSIDSYISHFESSLASGLWLGYAKYIHNVVKEIVFEDTEPSNQYGKVLYAEPDEETQGAYNLYTEGGDYAGRMYGGRIYIYDSQGHETDRYFIIDGDITYLKYSKVGFSWKLRRYDDNRIIEESLYNYLSELQKRCCCYYKRGGKTINNVVCLSVSENEDEQSLLLRVTIGEGEDKDLQGAFAWSNAKIYRELRRQFYVVEYRPMLDTYYTNYDYHYGEDNKPKSISNFNFPYNEVSDRQAYPILEYNLEKGLDTSRDIKIVTTDINILNVHAGDIVSYNGVDYLVNTVSTYINNKTIECSFSLTDNVVQNSVLSYYTDNVRISSVLSGESVVNRPVHLFGENVLHFYDYNNLENTNRTYTPNYFIEELGNILSRKALYGLELGDLSWDKQNSYKEISKYPFRFDQIIKPVTTDDVSSDSQYVIRLATGSPQDYSRKIELTDADFPLQICSAGMPVYMITDVIRAGVKTIKNFNELENELMNRGYYLRITKMGLPVCFLFMGIKKHGSDTWEYLYPSASNNGIYWPRLEKEYTWITGVAQITFDKIVEWSKDYIGNYRVYDIQKEYDTTLYGTEKLVTTSGLITKFEYAFPDSSYATSEFRGTSLIYSNNFESSINSNGTYNENFNTGLYGETNDISGVNILSTTPVYYNRTDTGCKLAGIGNNATDFYSLYKLNHISPYGYYLDMRENPRPYVQFKTLARGDASIIVKQLSNETKFMVCNVVDLNAPLSGQFFILRVPRFDSIANINVTPEYLNEHGYASVNVIQKLSDDKLCVLQLTNGDVLTKSDEYDYLLCLYDSEKETAINILKFNIADGKSVNKICIDNEIYSEI